LKVRPQVGIAQLCLADIYAQTGQGEKALKSLKAAEEIFKETEMEYWLSRTAEYLKLFRA
jgi:hypothetical protein